MKAAGYTLYSNSPLGEWEVKQWQAGLYKNYISYIRIFDTHLLKHLNSRIYN